jgi:carbonic anhydrase/acetyltransferase-like protein (isoleucine patch superfamily)
MPVIRGFREHHPSFGNDVFIAESASVIGDVHLEAQVSIWYGAVLRGDVGKIRVGARTNIQDNACIHMTHEISDAIIGSDVIIAHGVILHGAIVGNRALVGMNAVVMDNATVGEGAWVAAGSVVPPNMVIAPNMLVRGSPAKPVREVRPKEQTWAEGAIARYLELAAEHQL